MAKKKRVLDALLNDFEDIMKSFSENDDSFIMSDEELKADLDKITIHSTDEKYALWFESGYEPRDLVRHPIEEVMAYKEYYEKQLQKG